MDKRKFRLNVGDPDGSTEHRLFDTIEAAKKAFVSLLTHFPSAGVSIKYMSVDKVHTEGDLTTVISFDIFYCDESFIAQYKQGV